VIQQSKRAAGGREFKSRPRERTGAVVAKDGRNRGANGQNYPEEARQARACRTPSLDTASRSGDRARCYDKSISSHDGR